jgi:hypothetical protein
MKRKAPRRLKMEAVLLRMGVFCLVTAFTFIGAVIIGVF